jgi:CDP-diacylglycerol--glycerol-3-phosphate 3-phosphatidyltransferase
MSYKWIPNLLTSSRIILVPVFIYFLFSDYEHGKFIALSIFIIAAITDAYDGKIARKHNLITKFGIFFDPLADKFLILSAFYAFMFFPILSDAVKIWMIIMISFRDILVTILRTIMEYKGITMITSKLGKAKTAFQFITINLILVFLIADSYKSAIKLNFLTNEILYFFMFSTTIITFYTGIHYFYHNYKTLGNLLFKK